MLGMDRTGDTPRGASEPIAYARVSTDEQNLALQLDALTPGRLHARVRRHGPVLGFVSGAAP
jgi:hypothetical protein